MASFSAEVSINQCAEFFARFGRFGGDKEKLRRLLGDDKLMKWWLEQYEQYPGFQPIHHLFTPTSTHLTRVRELNSKRNWGFTDEDFAQAEQSVPEWPDVNLVVVTLVPYLPDSDGMGGVERTFQELWQVAASLQHSNSRWDGYDIAGQDKLRLLEGIEHPAKDKPVLRWEAIDLGCNRNRKPVDVRNPGASPHAGILASAILHPEWIKAMNGDEVPFVWAPGYEVHDSDKNSWQYVPDLYFFRGAGGIGLFYYQCDDCSSDWSVPSFARESLGSR